MTNDEWHLVEAPALEQLKALGWSYLDGTTLTPGKSNHRSSLKEVVLTPNLEQAIQRLNPWINADNLRKVVRECTLIQATTLMEANQWFWQRLTQTFSVDQDLGRGRRGQTLKLLDFENPRANEFLCVNQLTIQGTTQTIIPDITLFVNGLPLGVIECKSPSSTDPMAEAISQLRRYANLRTPSALEGAERLFHYNQVMIATYRYGARLGTISSAMEHYLEWKDPYPLPLSDLGPDPHSQALLIQGVLEPSNFLDLIQNFTVFMEEEGRTIKKLARYQQFRAVHKTLLRLKAEGDRYSKSGVIWHTQGSGKTLTMVFLILKIRRDTLLRTFKLLFLCDRTQLDDQLTKTIQNAQKGEAPHSATSAAFLQTLLRQPTSDLITSTIQKLQDANNLAATCLPASERIIVVADEAHRTQYGSLGATLNSALPKAPKIAFTGTPLIASQKTTNEFGPYIDTYTIEQAVADGATVPILYEGREVHTKVTGDSLDALFEHYFQDKSPKEKEEIKRKYGTERAVLEAIDRLRDVSRDLVRHYRTTILPNGFKGILVAGSREAAVRYKSQLDDLADAPQSAVIISGRQNDKPHLARWTNPADHKTAIAAFLKPIDENPLSLLIVKDMLLTGFDAPICQVMYLDRRLTDHTLLQAIARVNRTKAGKTCGYIVDYYGLTDDLADALRMFSSTDIQGALTPLKDVIPNLQAAHTRAMAHLKGLDLHDLDACLDRLDDELKRQRFQTDVRTFAKRVDMLLPNPAAKPFLPDLQALGKVVIACRNRYRDEQLDLRGCGEKVRALIDDHVRAAGIDPRVPPIQLFSVEFKERLDGLGSDRAKASELEQAIKTVLRVKLDDDPAYYQTLSRRLEEIIQKHSDKWAELVEQLLLFRDGMERERADQAARLGLSPVEFAFRNALVAELTAAANASAAAPLEGPLEGDTEQRVIALSQQLVRDFEEATTIVGFFSKWDEVARLKRQIKRAILDQPFGSRALVEAVTARFLELGKRHFP